jgi:hypothetical protein
MGEDEEYEEVIKEAKSIRLEYEHDMDLVPVSFAAEHRSMLGNCKMFLERDGGYIAINPKKCDKLITSLRTAVEYNDGIWIRKPHRMTIYLTPSGWQCATTGLLSPGLDR